MKRYLLDTGIAGRYIDRRDGVYERAKAEWSRGIIGQNDMMIAAIALTLGNTTVVTMDSDFGAVPGLTVENWAS